MCTVSFYPTKDSYIFTSNRDENINRPQAIVPEKIIKNNTTYYFSRDAKAFGTWFIISSRNTVAILLNGAFDKHIQKSHYKKSRGIVLLDLVYTNDILNSFISYNLVDIEPFQLLVFENNILTRLIWDGEKKQVVPLNHEKAYILSSATLYEKNIIEKREKEFAMLIEQEAYLSAEKIIDFHNKNKFAEIEIEDNKTKTVSISQAIIKKNIIQYTYNDTINNSKHYEEIHTNSLL